MLDRRLQRVGIVRIFVLLRRGWIALLLVLALSILTVLIGSQMAPVPGASRHNGTIPMWRVLAMGVGIVPALGLHSSLRDLEAPAGALYRRAECLYAAIVSIASIVAYLAISSISLSPLLLTVIARGCIAWLGLALLSGRLFGWRLSWVIPVTVSCALMYWGESTANGAFAWLDFSSRPHNDLLSLLASVLLLATGMAAYQLTPWRWRQFARWTTSHRS